MEFLYFPDDKMAYIPAAISLMVFMIAAVIVMRLILKVSKKEEQTFEEKYPDAKREEHTSDRSSS